jgi:hypothetical protein
MILRAQHRTSSTEEAARGGPRVSVENERLQAFSLIALLVIVGGIVLARPLRLVSRNLGDSLSLAATWRRGSRSSSSAGGPESAIEHGTLSNGGFCFSFVPDRPPPGYPSPAVRQPGNGERHRVTVIGPGVTPVIQWEGPGLGPYDQARDASFNAVFDSYLAGDPVCARER